MLQTNSSGPVSGALSLDMTPVRAAGRNGSGDGGFTQELDKHVKKAESRDRNTEPVKSQAATAKGRTADKGEAKDKSEAADKAEAGAKPAAKAEGEAAAKQAQQAANDEALSGKDLPLEPLRETADPAADPLLAVVTPALQGPSKTTIGLSVAGEATGQKLDASTQSGATKDEVAASLLLKDQPKEGRGERGFDSLLNLPGRVNAAASALDTPTPTVAPLAGQGASSPLAVSTPVAMTLATPLTQANWGGAVAERVVWMTNANIQEAEIQLHPRELGPIGIKITVQNEQTHVTFVAQHATTREALEAALPRLREMLADNGLQPGNTDVSQHSFRGRGGEAHDGSGRGGNGLADGALEGDEHLLGAEGMRGVGYATPSGVDAFA